MKYLRINILLGSLALISTLLYNNCARTEFISLKNGTSVGNPMAPVSSQVLFAVCSVINRCHPEVTIDKCQTNLMTTSGFSTPLGLSSSYDTFAAITQGEISGVLIGNQTSSSGCVDSINTLSCTDPSVVGAYDPSASNPYSGSPGMVPTASCNQVFSPGINLEVPIDMMGHGLASNTTLTAFSRTRTSLSTSDYDGAVTYAFEVNANNIDSVSRNVSLVNSSGAVVATIPVPVGPSNPVNPIRLRTSFQPTPGTNDYRVQLDGTNSPNQLQVWVSRILVKQVGATQTKVYVPLMVGAARTALTADDSTAAGDSTYSPTYSQAQFGWYALWRKNNSAFSQLATGNPWTFEAVLSSDASTQAYASVFDGATNLQVTASEVSAASPNPVLVSKSFADNSANFTDLDNMEVQIKQSGSGKAYVYRAGLWIKLSNLRHAEVYYRYLFSDYWALGYNASSFSYYRTLIDTSVFSGGVTVYNELTSAAASGTNCTESVFDNGQSDVSGTGAIVPNSSLTINATALSLQRSPPLNLMSGDRFGYYMSVNSGTSCYPVNGFLVLGF